MQIVADAFQRAYPVVFVSKKAVFAYKTEDLCMFYDPEISHKNH